jgi:hypothetical protein
VLTDCTAGSRWPERGVYFFFESGQERTDSGNGPRVVRIGTHALKPNAGTTLWNRLSAHRGPASTGRGNHRGSVFRNLVGAALAAREPGIAVGSWGVKPAPAGAAVDELALEERVSGIIRAMPFLWVAVPEASAYGLRAYIETNAIALLSNYERAPIDPPQVGWLGSHCDRALVRGSGLWNNHDVEKTHEAGFLRTLETLIVAMEHS